MKHFVGVLFAAGMFAACMISVHLAIISARSGWDWCAAFWGAYAIFSGFLAADRWEKA